MNLREIVKKRILKIIKNERSLINEILETFDFISDAELLMWLFKLYEYATSVESWRRFLVEVLQLDESRKVVLHYPAQLGSDIDDVYHIICVNLDHCKIVLDYFNFEGWISEVRLEVDHYTECQAVVDYILKTPAFKNITINLYTQKPVTDTYLNHPQITVHE